MGITSPRLKYLTEILGLYYDPFASPLAEHELKFEQDLDLSKESPRFLTYFTLPILQTPHGDELTLKDLRHHQHSFIYGAPGSGKTTLRINLDASCRTILDKTFSVHYQLGQEFRAPPTSCEHAVLLAGAIARDSFVLILEQFIPGKPVSQQQLEALRLLVDLGGRDLERLIQRILSEPEPEGYAGLADHWRLVGRIPVGYITASTDLLKMLQKVLQMKSCLSSNILGWERVWAAREAAEIWGAEAILVLIDGVDAVRRTPEEMMKYLTPLLEKLSSLSEQQIYAKFFLPEEIKAFTDDWFSKNDPDLCFSIQTAKIVWTEQALTNMIRSRFSSAGVRYSGFDELAKGTLQHQLDKMLLDEANNSPRRMLWLISNLINAHTATQPEQMKFDEKDWTSMLELVSA